MTQPAPAGVGAALLGQRLARTPLGQQEITARQLTLARPARNLLLIIDAKRSAGDWLTLVRGATEDDLLHLVASGLVAPAAAVGPAQAAAAPPAPAMAPAAAAPPAGPPATAPVPATGIPVATARISLEEALLVQSYRVLYDRMTAEARPVLGLIKGYKLILEIERCSGPDEIRQLAQRFVEQVRGLHGEAKARALAQRLADPP